MRRFVLFLALGLNSFPLFSQTYTQPTGNTATSSVVSCGGTYVDNGGSGGNYSNNQLSSLTIYPSVAGQYVTVTFTAFDTENGYDGIYVYDGPGGAQLATLTGTPAVPFSYTASSANGALTFVFTSDFSVRRSGWTATVSCTTVPGAGAGLSNSSQDCQEGGGTTVCGSSSFSGNSSGAGTVDDLPNSVNGCLGGENQSSWYYFSPSSAGTVAFMITPSDPTDDYDFAVYGPFTEVNCPFNVLAQPLRCSYAIGAGTGATGLQSGAGDNTEGSGGNQVVNPINVAADEVYVLVIDNYSGSTNPFDLNWTLTAGASLDCTTLPIELISFYGEMIDEKNVLYWTTATETNNNFFTIERSNGNDPFEPIGMLNGAGNSNTPINYSFWDENPLTGYNYYRLRQTDFDGQMSYSSILNIYNLSGVSVSPVYPNPTTNTISFELHSYSEEEFTIQITDVTGKSLRDQNIQMDKFKKVTLDLEPYNQGVYFLSVRNKNGEVISTQKLLKN